MITLEQIGKRLQEELKASGLTQTEIAVKLYLSKQAVHRYFHGLIMPALDTFANLCKELDIDPLHVLCLDD